MRVILVGTAGARARLRARLAGRGVDVLAEAPTLAAARALEIDVDGFLVASGDDASAGATLGREPLSSTSDRDRPEEPLTPRERDVLALLAEGLANRAIAARLGISDQTVKFHVASIYGKLDAANRTDAVRRAVQRGLITL